ncbi:MAG: ABC transporter permease [Candidatus Njordarchaeota archaeon]
MEFIILAFEALKERKIRSIFTIIMVIVGVALIVGVTGISIGTRNFISGEIEKFGTNIIIVYPSGGESIGDATINEISRMEGVETVIPVVSRPATMTARGVEKDAMIVGIEFSKLYYLMPELKLEDGIIPPERDPVGVVLGYQIAYNPDGSVYAEVGDVLRTEVTLIEEDQVRTKEKSLVVRGVFSYFGSFVIPVDSMLWIPLEVAKKFFEADGYDTVYVIVRNESIVNQTAETIADKYNLRVVSPQEIIETVNRIMGAIDLYIGAISVVSLLVAGIGIITTLYTSMLERIREIGVLKAIGFKGRHILMLFLYEALLIGIIGTIFGMIGGVVLSRVLVMLFFSKLRFPIQPVFTLEVFVRAGIMAIGLSAISGLYPAWRASKLDPVVALRYE